MIRPFSVLIFVAASIQPLARAQTAGPDGPVASHSCFQRPDHCLREFAATHDRDSYDLCLISDRVCRDHRFNWKLMRLHLKKGPDVLNDCFPDHPPASQ